MKQALIGGLSALALIIGVSAANAQANINPNVYPGNTSGPYGAPQKWDWYAGPGPERRGNMCLSHVDINRGYGFQKPCPAPAKAAAPAKKKAATKHYSKKKKSAAKSSKKKVASR